MKEFMLKRKMIRNGVCFNFNIPKDLVEYMNLIDGDELYLEVLNKDSFRAIVKRNNTKDE